MTSKPISGLVSIVIPTYNMRGFVAEAIDSALAQTYPHVEVIVVDDGSTDGTGDYVQGRYGSRVRYAHQPNAGRGAARNHGLRLARGDYVQFLDADDLLYPHKLATHVACLQAHPEYAAAYGDTLVAYEDDIEHPSNPDLRAYYVSGDILQQEIHRPFLWTNAVLVRHSWVGRVNGLDETLRSNEDWDLWLRIAVAGGQFAYVPGEAVALYRRPRQPRGNASTHQESGIRVLRKLEKSLDAATRRRLRVRSALGQWLFSYGQSLADDGQRLRGLGTMMSGMLLDQHSLRAKLARLGLCCLPLGPSRRETLFWRLRRLRGGT